MSTFEPHATLSKCQISNFKLQLPERAGIHRTVAHQTVAHSCSPNSLNTRPEFAEFSGNIKQYPCVVPSESVLSGTLWLCDIVCRFLHLADTSIIGASACDATDCPNGMHHQCSSDDVTLCLISCSMTGDICKAHHRRLPKAVATIGGCVVRRAEILSSAADSKAIKFLEYVLSRDL